jgi:hypothetical protein
MNQQQNRPQSEPFTVEEVQRAIREGGRALVELAGRRQKSQKRGIDHEPDSQHLRLGQADRDADEGCPAAEYCRQLGT